MISAVASLKSTQSPQEPGPSQTVIKPLTAIPGHLEGRKNILFVTSELADLVKTGGLGEVVAALPRALHDKHDVRVLIPGYREVMQGEHPVRPIAQIPAHAGLPACQLGRLDLPDGLIVYVVICPSLYEREGNPYCDTHGNEWPDNPIRYARLSMAAVDMAAGVLGQWVPQLLHAHDWPTGLVPAYARWRNIQVPTIFTIHNLGYQGMVNMTATSLLGIPDSACQIEEMEFYGQLSLLKAGIAYAQHVTTVSVTYAQEITTPEFGFGLDGFLRKKASQGKLSGICNGIDESWDPMTDSHLLQPFDIREWHGKQLHASYVRQRFGMRPSNGPLFGVVSRLVQQKGFDLTLALARDILQAGGQLAIIGCGEPAIEAEITALAAEYPQDIGVYVGFNDTEARRIYAGSDFLLMPSRYEPCGLSQMYAQRFGCLPIARRTGGLADTIEDGLTGFLFSESTYDSYRLALRRALHTYKHPTLLNAMRCRAMSAHFFWHQSTLPYERLYQHLTRTVEIPATTLPV